jgi:N-acyl-D-amino-acid deacylase
MTGAAAAHMGMADRGLVRPGMKADLVLFDPDRIADRATSEDPNALSVGVQRVWVNGEQVLEDGRPTGVHSGRPILRGVAAKTKAAR